MIQSNTLQITAEILSLIAGIDEFKGAWRALVSYIKRRKWAEARQNNRMETKGIEPSTSALRTPRSPN